MDLSALHTEITTDPTGLGYATANGDNAVAALFNAPRAGISVSKGIVQGYEVINALDAMEVAALTAIQLQRLGLLTGASGGVDTGSANTRTLLGVLFTTGSISRANLIALATRQGSRAEQLFGPGTFVDDVLVARAR